MLGSKLTKLFGNKLTESHMRYALYRWVLPQVGVEPFATRNLAEKAWPKVAALTAARRYTDQIESITWEPKGDDDGTDLLEDYTRTSRPVVLKGYAAASPAASWTLEQLKHEAQAVVTRVRVGDYASDAGEAEFVNMRVADFVDYLMGRSAFPYPERLVDGMGPYLGNMRIPVLTKQVPCPRAFSDSPYSTIWLGSPSSITPLHCHQHGDVLLIQLLGRRKVMLVPPHQAPLVGCVPVNINICTATYDPFAPDREQFPGSDLVHRLYYELEPGDALLIPGFWFHAVQLAEPSMSASHFRTAMPAVIGGGSPQPWRTKAYSRGW